jgi:hypothetical protein
MCQRVFMPPEGKIREIILPKHLQRFPGMQPWIGDHYQDDRHKRLLIIGESHYLPEGSIVHHDPGAWYTGSQDDLSDEERKWICTAGNIRFESNRAHTIYGEIARVLSRTMDERGLTHDDFVFGHISYCNYFLRPAPVAGGSMAAAVRPRDLAVAEDVLNWFIRRHRPELVAVASKAAGRHAEKILGGFRIPYLITYYAGSPFWLTRFRDDLSDFLKDHQWLNTTNTTS